MNITYSNQAAKVIGALDKSIKASIKDRIEGLAKMPPEGDIKPLRGYSKEKKHVN